MNRKQFLSIEYAMAELEKVTANWPEPERAKLTEAITFARERHRGVDYEPAPEYAIHPIRAALTVATHGADPHVVTAAVLHDTIEDTETTEDELRERFGDRVATLVKMMSHRYGPDTPLAEKIAAKRENLEQIKQGPEELRLIKCADLLDQMTNWKYLPKQSQLRDKLLRFLEEAQSYALPLAEATNEHLANDMRRELQWHHLNSL